MKNKSWFKPLILSSCVFAILNFSVFAAQNEPWWHDAQLEWKPFTALPVLPSGSEWRWEIKERNDNGVHKFFIQSAGSNDDKLFVANSIIPSPSFDIFTNIWLRYVTSTALVKWEKQYQELFIGSSTGIWRFDEDSNQLVSVWFWSWDATRIVSLGDGIIYGAVNSWGSESGTHLWTPSGETRLQDVTWTGFPPIWADPISGRYGKESYKVRVVSTNFSIIIGAYTGGGYSFDGALSFQTPIGIPSGGGNELYVSDFYEYSNTNIIVNTGYNEKSLYIGPLGGTMYPLNCPADNISTFFYSPTTRIIIAGDARTETLFYAVLPGPDEVLGPKLNIQEAFIISWESKYGVTNLESTTNLSSGNWTTVTAPQNVISNKIQVAVPKEQQMFFRLTSP